MAVTQTSDIGLFQSDMRVIDGDINTSEVLYQTIYISLFGGNLKQSTIGNEIDTEERFDYWANSLLFATQKEKQFNSETQRTLKEVALNTSGRLKIKQSVENDLFFLKNIVKFEVDVYIESSSRIRILINVISLSSNESKLYQLLWDNAKQEVIIDETI